MSGVSVQAAGKAEDRRLMWLIEPVSLSFPAHTIVYFFSASYSVQNSCAMPSLVSNSGEKGTFSFLLITNNDVFLPQNTLKTFYCR